MHPGRFYNVVSLWGALCGPEVGGQKLSKFGAKFVRSLAEGGAELEQKVVPKLGQRWCRDSTRRYLGAPIRG